MSEHNASGLGVGVPASELRVAGETIMMTPSLVGVTPESSNIRYMELSFGSGTPKNIKDVAIAQCDLLGKTAIYKISSRCLIQDCTVKAYCDCIPQKAETNKSTSI
ncbi:MAG: hypothetical protein ACI8VC_000160 [Candidatus Endobugula sp.]|jgi:hypothetical protein